MDIAFYLVYNLLITITVTIVVFIFSLNVLGWNNYLAMPVQKSGDKRKRSTTETDGTYINATQILKM